MMGFLRWSTFFQLRFMRLALSLPLNPPASGRSIIVWVDILFTYRGAATTPKKIQATKASAEFCRRSERKRFNMERSVN
jgi:hypothetical protein